MNRIYRVVWNTSLNLWVAVAETARGKGKSAATVVLNVAAASLLVPAGLASAQAVPSATVAGGAARAFVAPNGVTVVNIEAANAAGLSHNRYTQFNVNPAGLVLNNANAAAQANWQSQLAGQLAANPNLGAPARIILNEVVSNNRSTLAGFTEVLGGRADVVLANPYGITCSGCGFINTDRVTLTTGLPTIGPDGSLRGFAVQQGDILVNGNGLNATAQQVLDLVARSVRIEGSISANDLGITTGTNAWDYGSRAVAGNAGALGSTPNYAIDSTALGGMYANRIRMTATEAGVGVRMLGDAAATADDFTISAAGRIELGNRISAQRDLALNSAAAITMSGGSLTAARDLNIAAGADVATIVDGALVAGQNLGVSGAALVLNAGTLLQAGNALTARATAGDLGLGGAAIVAGGAMQLSSAGMTHIEAGANQGVQSRTGDIAINAAGGLDNAGAVSADAGNLSVRAGTTLTNSGTLNAGQNLTLADAAGSGSQALNNSGVVLASQAIDTQAASLVNSGVMRAGTSLGTRATTVDNSGWLQATAGANDLVATDLVNRASGNVVAVAGTLGLTLAGTLDNSGYVGSGQALNVQAVSIANRTDAYIGSSVGALALAATGALDNAGVVLAEGNSASLTAGGTLTNSGDLGAQQALAVQAARIDNTASGYMVSGTGPLALTAASTLTNNGAVSANAGTVTLSAGDAITNVGSGAAFGAAGTISAGGDLVVGGLGGGAVTQFSNSGYLVADGMLRSSTFNAANAATGWIQAAQGSTVRSSGFVNDGTWLLSTAGGAAHDTVALGGGFVNNNGTLQSARDLDVSGAGITNSKVIFAGGNLGLSSTGYRITNVAGATMQAGGTLTVNGAYDVVNEADALMLGTNVSINSTANPITGLGLDNRGTIAAQGGDTTLRLAGALDNSGTLYGSANLDISAQDNPAAVASVRNSGNLLSDGRMTMRVGSLTNTASGTIQNAGYADVFGTGALLNDGQWLAGTGAADKSGGSVTFQGDLTNRATMQSTGDVTFTGATVENQAGASMRADHLTVRATDANGFGLVNAGTMQGDSVLSMNVASGLWNQAGATLLGSGLSISADTITNAGTIQLNGADSYGGSVNATNTFSNLAGGRVIAQATTNVGTSLTLNAKGFFNDDGAVLRSDATSRLNINVGVDGFHAAGDIDTAGGLALAARNGNDFTAVFDGAVHTGDLFAMTGGAGSQLLLAADKNIVAGSVAITAGTVMLGTNGVLQSGRAMRLNVGTLGYDASNRIMAGMDAPLTGVQSNSQIMLGSALVNDSLLFSGSNLDVRATSITNGATGGIAALGNLMVTAGTGDLMNRGALYAGGTLTAAAENGTLTNAATATAYQGSIDAGTSISLSANTLVNNSTISTPGDITVQANTIRNEVLGGDTRTTTTTLQPAVLVTSGRTSDNLPYYDYTQLWSTQQSRNGGGTLPAQMTAGGRLDAIFGNFYNLGGLLSGNVVALRGLSPAAVFTNDSLQLQTVTYRSTYYALNGSYYTGSCALDTRYCLLNTQMSQEGARNASRTQTGATSSGGFGGGIYANTLTGTSFALVNNGVTGANLQTARTGTPGDVTPGAAPGATPLTPDAGDPLSPSAGVGLLGSTGFAGSGGTGTQTGQTRTGSALVRNIDATTLAANAANGVSGLSFGGIHLNLPTNPNGYFVLAREPNARYLVETNANYQIAATSVGSDYLDGLLGYSSDQTLLRLGDASYEAYLVKQQLISQTGHDVLGDYQNAGAQMKGLMDSAAQASTDLALTYGQALTPAQQASLKSDMVWMVATEINGKTVLAPVVYLSAATRNAVVGGTVISAKDADLNLTSLTNTGGTIIGSNSLRVASVGNITNTSGTIAGGNVALGSSSGSIINQTTSTAQGTNKSSSTLIGKTAGIEATGALLLSAKKDITNVGAVVTAGGDATLVAGRSISFDTIADKSGSATTTHSSNLFGSTTKRTTTSAVKQVGSTLTAGGTLVAQAGQDITFAGTDVKVAGDAALLAGGNVGIVSRENSSVTSVKKSSSGIGVGGSVYGTQKSTLKSTSVRNDASTLNVGGDAVVTAGKDVTVRGSDVNVAGSGLIAAANVNVQAGRDYDETHKRTVTAGIGKIVGSNQAGGNTDKASTVTSTATGAEFGSSAGKGAAQVAAGASAGGGANASGGVALMSRTVQTVDTADSRNVASNVRFGGDARIDATGTVTLKGSNLDTAGALGINANRLDVLAGQDVKTSRVQTDTTNVGFMASTANSGSTNASAGMSAVGQGMPGGSAEAGAGVAASSDNRVSLMEQSIVDTKTRDVTSVGSGITAGKGLTANVRDTIILVGSSVKSGGDMTLNAGNIVSKAADDAHETSTTNMQLATGYYAGASGGANAQANGAAGLGGAAGTTADAGVSAEVGAYTTTTMSKSEAANTTARVSSIESGGNLTRNARGAIVDVGTKIDVKGSLDQSADTIVSMAAQDTARSSSESFTLTGKTGLYAESGANAQAQARLTNTGKSTTTVVPPEAPAASPGVKPAVTGAPATTGAGTPAVASSTGAGASATPAAGATGAAGAAGAPSGPATPAGGGDGGGGGDTGSANSVSKGNSGLGAGAMVGAGVAASFDLAQQANSASSTTARASTINVGGTMTSTSRQSTTLQATQITAGRDVNIAAGSLDYQAAANTSQSSSSSTSAGGSASLDLVNNTGTVSAYGSRAEGSDKRSTAVTGAINAGGGVNVTTTGNTRLEGTQIAAAGPVTVNAGGALALDAARDSASATSRGGAAAVSATAGADQVSASASMNFGQSQTSSSSDRVVAIGSGNGVTLQSGGNMTMVGPQVNAKGDVNVAAGGSLDIGAARDKASIDAFQVAASVSAGVGIQQIGEGAKKSYRANQGSAAGTGGAGVQVGDRDAATGGSFNTSGGAVAFQSGGGTTMTGTQASGVRATTVTAGGAFVAKDAVSTSKGVSFGAQAAAAGASEELEKEGKRAKTPAAGTTPATTGATPSATATTPSTTGTAVVTAPDATSPVGSSPSTPWTSTQPTTGSAARPSDSATSPTIGGSRPATVPAAAGATPLSQKEDMEKTLTTKQLTGASGSGTMNVDVDNSTSKQAVNLGAGGGGMSVVSNTSSGQAKLSAQAQVPSSLPRGMQVTATTSDGSPLPAWLRFDPKTGTVTGTPPPGFTGDVRVTVNVPQRDGTVKKTPLVMTVR